MMKEVIYIMQTKSSFAGEWKDTSNQCKNRAQSKADLIAHRKFASEIGSPSVFRIIKQTRQALYEDES